MILLGLSEALFAQSGISFKFHQGEAILKTDLLIDGEFKYQYSKNDLPFFLVKDNEVKGVKRISVPMFRKLTLVGAERGVSSRKDTTIFVWVDQFDDLLRVVREGKVMIYDNSKIIDEEHKELESYLMIGERQNFGIKTVKKLSDLESILADEPYFIKSAKATGKYESRDFRVIMYLVDLFNDSDPMRNLKWKSAEIKTKGGKYLKGQAYLQPLDLRNEYNTDKFAYVHYYDNNGFQIFRNDELEYVKIEGTVNSTGYYGLTNKFFFGMNWTHEGDEYLITRKIVNRNNYFYYNRNINPQDFIVLRKVSGTFMRPDNEPELRQTYFSQNPIGSE